MRFAYLFPMVMLVGVVVSACQNSLFPFGFLGEEEAAKARLSQMFQELPKPPGSILLDRKDLWTGGTRPECQGRGLEALFGTNERTFAEVLDFYNTEMQATGWEMIFADNRGRTFLRKDGFAAAVSDLYNVSHVSQAAIDDGTSRFRTLYLLEMSTANHQPAPKICSGG